jgi:uncharacterized integral membrane protein
VAVLRVLKTLFWLLIAAVLVTVGLANRGMVELKLLPPVLEARVGVLPDLEMPLFLVILGSVALGLLIGFVWEWIREIPERAEARRLAAELARLRGAAEAERREAARTDVLAGIGLPAVPRR